MSHWIDPLYNKFIMIDRIFFHADGQTPNPYGILASEYDVTTDTWRDWSSGITSSDSVRLLQSCGNGSCQFVENDNDPTPRLLAYRWYPTAVVNWDGRLLIASGTDLDQGTGTLAQGALATGKYAAENDLSMMKLPVDLDTSPSGIGNGTSDGPRALYPHMHLQPTYEYFVCSTNQWWVGFLFAGSNYLNKGPGFLDPRYADGGTPVYYPGAGMSGLRPMVPPYSFATVVLCGATWGYNSINTYVDPDCAVITPSDPNPVSSRTGGVTMLHKRIMPYCIIMLDGNVACMMGAESGFSGYYSAINPQLTVDLLNTTTMTFTPGATATVPCLYHSIASLAFTHQSCALSTTTPAQSVAVINPGFSTHNQQMSQRYVFLACTCVTPVARLISSGSIIQGQCSCTIPSNYAVMPPGDYLITLLDGGVPSPAQWISIAST
ncbi:hypothetical protein WJX81_001214 [Elliptochloris bilobata]|uniref:YHYH domain-containing protein n=1 Tax=Elliptochloris bilobata TaxID=381761 RepID=A0AAW1RM90_9CHLO